MVQTLPTMNDKSTFNIKLGCKQKLESKCKDVLLTLRFYSQKPSFVTALAPIPCNVNGWYLSGSIEVPIVITFSVGLLFELELN